MSITITITDPTPAQIAALFGTQDNAKPAGKAKVDAASTTKADAAPETASKTKADASPSEEAAETNVPSIDDVKAAAQALVGKNGREALADLLEQFGAKNLSTVSEDKRAAFIEKCNA